MRLLLVASLAANAALLAFLAHRPGANATTGNGTALSPLPTAGTTARVSPPSTLGDPATLSPAALRDRLRALGLPAEVVNALVTRRIQARYQARLAEVRAEALRTTPWWRTRKIARGYLGAFNAAQSKELRELEAAARDETLAVLGPQALDPDGAIAARYSFVSPAKAVQLQALETDYLYLAEELKAETRSIRTAADNDREKFIETERQRDIASLLTPAEREIYALRDTRITNAGNFMGIATAFQPADDEYRTLASVQQQFAERFPLVPMAGMGMVQRGRLIDQPDLLEQLRTSLGDARYAEWQLANDRPYQLLATYGDAIGVTRDMARDISQLINDAPAASVRIISNNQLTPSQKAEAIIAVAAEVRAKLTTQIGAENAGRVLDASLYFKPLESGRSVQITPRGVTIGAMFPSPPSQTVRPRP